MSNIDLNTLLLSQGYTIGGGINSQTYYSNLAMGDINGDGFADTVIVAPYAAPFGRSSGGLGAGMASVIFGKAKGQANIDLISEASGFRIIGANAGDLLSFRNNGGNTVAIGDVNGDGYDDIVIGGGYIQAYTGKAYVIFGKSGNFADIDLANLAAADGFKINGANAGDSTGSSIALGDVNNDGFKDIIIGAPGTSAQAAYVIFGKANGNSDINLASLAANVGFKISGNTLVHAGYGTFTGCSVASVDMNGDGYDDVMVSASGIAAMGKTGAGVVFAIYGKSSMVNLNLASFNSSIGIMIMGADAGTGSGVTGLGTGPFGVGDINNDNYGDLIVGLPNASPLSRANAGVGYVIFGGSSMTNVDLANLAISSGFKIIGAVNNDQAGSAIYVSDINKDSYGDVIIGSPSSSPLSRSYAGNSAIVYGKASGFADVDLASLSVSAGFRIIGATLNAYSGKSIATGDINGDGFIDIVVGGNVGAALGTVINAVSNPLGSFVNFPLPVSNATNPILPMLPTVDLSNLPIPKGYTIGGGINSQTYLNNIAVGDINGDGYADTVITAPYAAPLSVNNQGMATVVFGKAAINDIDITNLANTAGFGIYGASSGDNLGYKSNGGNTVAVGDINNDGYEDIVIGVKSAAPYVNPFIGDPGRSQGGITYVLFGKSAGFANINLANLSSTDGFKINGAISGDLSGSSIAIGDVNKDGFKDIIIAAPSQSAQSVYVVFGKANGFSDIDLASLSANAGFKLYGNKLGAGIYGSNTGSGLATADMNGDGYSDIIIGAPGAYAINRGSAGLVFVIYGKQNATNVDLSYLSKSTGFIVMGANVNDGLGGSAFGVGDINNDNYEDLVIGAPGATPLSRANAGVGYTIFGGPNLDEIDLANFGNYAGFKIMGAVAQDRIGSAIYVSDINQDGYKDIIMGVPNSSPLSRGNAGSSIVIFGKASGFSDVDLVGLSNNAGFRILGESANVQSGTCVATGDMNGDGFMDIAISNNIGAAFGTTIKIVSGNFATSASSTAASNSGSSAIQSSSAGTQGSTGDAGNNAISSSTASNAQSSTGNMLSSSLGIKSSSGDASSSTGSSTGASSVTDDSTGGSTSNAISEFELDLLGMTLVTSIATMYIGEFV